MGAALKSLKSKDYFGQPKTKSLRHPYDTVSCARPWKAMSSMACSLTVSAHRSFSLAGCNPPQAAAGKYTDFTAHFSGFRLEGLPGSPVPTSIPWVDDRVRAPKVQASGNKTSNPASLK